jgi:hypothetical protein
MLTLDELKEAVEIYHNGHANDWPLAAEVCATFTREYIAREQLLDTELTAEMAKTLLTGIESENEAMGEILDTIQSLQCNDMFADKFTIRHLLAAACLAGVTVDLSRLDQPAIDI